MTKSRNYSSGTIRALYTLSRGFCYAPQCSERVLRNLNGDWFSKVQIAHIYAHKSNGPRFNAGVPEPERRRFHNLLLLCVPHHQLVDSKQHEATYTVELLKDWKATREGDDANALADINENDVQSMLVESVVAAKDEILTAISAISNDHQEAKVMLKSLLDEAFNRPYFDLDAISTLDNAARMLGPLEHNAAALSDAARMLGPLEHNAAALSDAARMLGPLESNASMLMRATDSLDLNRLDDVASRFEIWEREAGRLQHSSTNFDYIEGLANRLEQVQIALTETYAAHSGDRLFNDKFKNGVIVGLVMAAAFAAIVAIAVTQSQ